MGISGVAEFLSEALILIFAAVAGVLAFHSAVALLAQRRQLVLVFVKRIRALVPRSS